jgi:hypothetical protein
MVRFVDWNNSQHRRSASRYVTPDERHSEGEILARRHPLYQRVP